MDVSGWTVDQRMRLPDWCFPNRQIISVFIKATTGSTWYFGISDIALPDPCCIWSIGWFCYKDTATNSLQRVGLRATVPANAAEMDAAAEILPHFGEAHAGPNYIRIDDQLGNLAQIPLRHGLVTGGLKFVAGFFILTGIASATIFLVVSGLPTSMAGWLAHNKV